MTSTKYHGIFYYMPFQQLVRLTTKKRSMISIYDHLQRGIHWWHLVVSLTKGRYVKRVSMSLHHHEISEVHKSISGPPPCGPWFMNLVCGIFRPGLCWYAMFYYKALYHICQAWWTINYEWGLTSLWSISVFLMTFSWEHMTYIKLSGHFPDFFVTWPNNKYEYSF